MRRLSPSTPVRFAFAVTAMLAALHVGHAVADEQQESVFEEKIAPILIRRCVTCCGIAWHPLGTGAMIWTPGNVYHHVNGTFKVWEVINSDTLLLDRSLISARRCASNQIMRSTGHNDVI